MPTPAWDSNGNRTRWPCADRVAVRGSEADVQAGVGEGQKSGGGYVKRRRLEEDTPRADKVSGACEPPVRRVKILSWTAHECIHIGAAVQLLQGEKRGQGSDGGQVRGSAQEERGEQEIPPGEDAQEKARGRWQQEPAVRGAEQFSAESEGKQFSAEGDGRQFSDEDAGRQFSDEGEGRQFPHAGDWRHFSADANGKQFSPEGDEKQWSAERAELPTGRDVLVGKADGTNHAEPTSHAPQSPQPGATARGNIHINVDACRGGKLSTGAEAHRKGVQRAGVFKGMDVQHGPCHSDHMEDKMRCV